MPTIESKLDLIKRIMIEDATRARDAILEQLNQESSHQLADSKAAIDKEAHERQAKAEASATQASDATISRANIDARKRLIEARDRILAEVLGKLSLRLEAFASSDGYKDYLMGNIADALKSVGYGAGSGSGAGSGFGSGAQASRIAPTVTLTPGDIKRYRADVARLAPGATIVAGAPSLIGGCKTADAARGIYADNTLQMKVSLCADELSSISGLRIDGSGVISPSDDSRGI